MARLQQGDSTIGRFLHYWKTNHPPTLRNLMKEKKGSRKLLRDWKQIEEKDGLLYRKITENGHVVRQLLLPESLKEKLMDAVHDKARHPGSEKTIQLARSRCFWPQMVRDITNYCNLCSLCTLAKAGKKIHTKMGSLQAKRPLEVLAIDYTVLEPFGGMENVLVMTDVCTKFMQAVPTPDQKAKTVAKVLVKQWFV